MKAVKFLGGVVDMLKSFGGNEGAALGGLLERVADLVRIRGVEGAEAKIRSLLADPPHEANLERMEEALAERRAREGGESPE